MKKQISKTFCFKLFAMLWMLATRSVFGADATQDGSAADDAELQRLRGLAVEAVKAVPAEQGKKWSDFLSQSKDFAETHPSLKIWLLRATAALANNDNVSGKEAGSKLVSLNALSSEDDLVKKIMASLLMKGWLSVPTPLATQEPTPVADPSPGKDDTIAYLNDLLKGEYTISYDDKDEVLVIEDATFDGVHGLYTIPVSKITTIEPDQTNGDYFDITTSDTSISYTDDNTPKYSPPIPRYFGSQRFSTRNDTAPNNTSDAQKRRAVNALRHLVDIIRVEQKHDPFDK